MTSEEIEIQLALGLLTKCWITTYNFKTVYGERGRISCGTGRLNNNPVVYLVITDDTKYAVKYIRHGVYRESFNANLVTVRPVISLMYKEKGKTSPDIIIINEKVILKPLNFYVYGRVEK